MSPRDLYMPLITTDLELAIDDLKQGRPVAIPTETVYGLAALIDQETAIRAVFAMKKRPLDHPLIVHVAHDWDVRQWVDHIPEYAQRLMDHFWPGPLTIVLSCENNQVSPLITGGQTTVALRCPSHPLAQSLLQRLQTPLVAPSANPFGKISPTTALHVQQSFSQERLTILDGGRCQVGIESTIVDASQSDVFQILRHGCIHEKEIAAISCIKCLSAESALRVPGKLECHYQPNKTLYYFSDPHALELFCQKRSGEVFVIAAKKPPTVTESHFYPLEKHPSQVAFDLYFQLRKADQSDARVLAIELPPDSKEWQGVRERILKAGKQGL